MNIAIIGASHGVGESLLTYILENKQEAHVYSFSRTQPAQLSNHHSWTPFDVKNSEELTGLPETLDAFFYCPGSVKLGMFQRFQVADYQEDLALNVFGAIQTLKAALPALKKSVNSPSVTLFSSVVVQTGMPMHSLVSVSKGAVEGLTRNLAAELAPKIRVNAIAPSLTETPLTASLTANPKSLEASQQRHPLKRIGTATEIAQTAAFIGLEATWMTGQIIKIDGGLSSLRT